MPPPQRIYTSSEWLFDLQRMEEIGESHTITSSEQLDLGEQYVGIHIARTKIHVAEEHDRRKVFRLAVLFGRDGLISGSG